ncbi:MAG: hypothetical protein ACYTGS_04090 [Planctomycetota bacterium]|jgi:ribosomal protein S27E
MPILEKRLAIITCDACGKDYMPDWHDLSEAMLWARDDGWSVFVTVLCPGCLKATAQATTPEKD